MHRHTLTRLRTRTTPATALLAIAAASAAALTLALDRSIADSATGLLNATPSTFGFPEPHPTAIGTAATPALDVPIPLAAVAIPVTHYVFYRGSRANSAAATTWRASQDASCLTPADRQYREDEVALDAETEPDASSNGTPSATRAPGGVGGGGGAHHGAHGIARAAVRAGTRTGQAWGRGRARPARDAAWSHLVRRRSGGVDGAPLTAAETARLADALAAAGHGGAGHSTGRVARFLLIRGRGSRGVAARHRRAGRWAMRHLGRRASIAAMGRMVAALVPPRSLARMLAE
jgi:hypothetical protein